jgi:hypothetical protein
MIAPQQFRPSDSESSDEEASLPPVVSVLRHLPAPRALLCPQHLSYEL